MIAFHCWELLYPCVLTTTTVFVYGIMVVEELLDVYVCVI